MSNIIDPVVRITVSAGAAALILLPAPGFAQQASGEKSDVPAETETVVVTGIRASYERAIEAKRNADAIVDVISAEDVGKFPDQNVAESLSHLPGLSVDRQFGQGEKVSILGTDPALNRVLINGQTVATADWGGDPNDPSARTFNYLLLSPELIGTAEVYKSQEARIDEGSIGGTVIIHTRKPLDLAANTLRATGGYEYNDRSKGGNVRGSLLYSWKNDSDSLGVLASYTHDKETLARAGLEIFGYSPATDFASAPNARITGDPANAIYPAGISADYFSQERRRDGVSLTLQGRPTDSLKLDLTDLFITGKYDNVSQALFIFPAASASLLQSATINNGLVTSASYGDGAYTEHDADVRKSSLRTNSLNFTAEWDSGGPFTGQGVLGTTKGFGGKDPEYLADLRGQSAYSYSYTGTSATVNWAQSPLDPTTISRPVGQQVGGIGYYNSGDAEKYAQTDWTWKVEAGPLSKLLAGVKYTDHANYELDSTSKVFVPAGGPLLESQLSPGVTPSGLWDGVGLGGELTHWATVGPSALINYDLANTGPFTESKGTEFDLEEKTFAAYVEGAFEGKLAGKSYHGNVGVRFVHTSDDSIGYVYDQTGVGTPAETVNKYTKALPSANFAWEAVDDVLLRLGVAKVIARPRYSDLTEVVTTDNLAFTAGGGNPNLKPYESVNYNVSGEWYFSRGSLLALDLFYRDISQYIVNTEHDEMLYNSLSGKTALYFVTTPINAEKAAVKGAELQFKMPIVAGFGIDTNYTYTHAQTTNGYNMPYLSKSTWNLIPYYERGPFSGRVSYGYRSQYFTSIGRLNAPQFTAEYKELDASASWNVTTHLQFTVNALNLLDQLYDSFDGVQAAPIGLYKNGRQYTAQITYRN
jgi:iron complex outermembrane receptor protein